MNWDERYRRGEHVHDPALAFIERLTPAGEGRRALDIACGAGRHAVLMAGRGWQVTAVDYSEAALAMVHARDARIETVLADLEAGAFAIEPGAWNMICISFYMQRSLFGAIREGLAPCGLLVAAFPLAGMRQEFLMEPGELRGLFEEGFEILHYAENGRAAELFARKL